MTDKLLWKNTVPTSPLTLRARAEPDALRQDVPGSILTRLPPNVKDLCAIPHGWAGRRGDGYDQLIWTTTGEQWSRATFPSSINITHNTNNALILGGKPRSMIWEVDPTNAKGLDALFAIQGSPILSVAHLDADDTVSRDGMGKEAKRLAILLEPGTLLLARCDDDTDDASETSTPWRVESCWQLTTPNTTYNHVYDGIRAINGGEIILISETVWSNDPPLEQSQIIALALRDDTPRVVAYWEPIPGHKEDKYGRVADILSCHTGPYEGPMYDANRYHMRALPDPWIVLDLDFAVIDGLDTLPEDLSAYVPLSPETAPTLMPITEAPTVQVVHLNPTVPEPQRDTLEPLTQRLLELMSAQGPRREPNTQVLELLGITMPDDLYAFLHTWAHQMVRVYFEHIDWWVDVQPNLTTHEFIRDDAPHAITIGTTGGGQPYVARIYDITQVHYLGIDDEGYPFLRAHSFEQFLEALVQNERQYYPINPTEFDDLM